MYHPRHSLLYFLLITLTALFASLQANNAANTAPSEPLRDSLDKIRWRAQSGDAYYQGYLGICHRTGYKDAELSKTKARHTSNRACCISPLTQTSPTSTSGPIFDRG